MESESRGTSAKTQPVKVAVDAETSIFVEARVLPGGEADVKASDQPQQFAKVAGAIEKVTR